MIAREDAAVWRARTGDRGGWKLAIGDYSFDVDVRLKTGSLFIRAPHLSKWSKRGREYFAEAATREDLENNLRRLITSGLAHPFYKSRPPKSRANAETSSGVLVDGGAA